MGGQEDPYTYRLTYSGEIFHGDQTKCGQLYMVHHAPQSKDGFEAQKIFGPLHMLNVKVKFTPLHSTHRVQADADLPLLGLEPIGGAELIMNGSVGQQIWVGHRYP